MRKRISCPFCSEEIMPEAKKCRFCGEWLNKPKKTFLLNKNAYSIGFAIIVLLCFAAAIYARDSEQIQKITSLFSKPTPLPTVIPTPTPIDGPKLMQLINLYREENSRRAWLYDDQTCDIANRLLKSGAITTINLADNKDLCPTCTSLGLGIAEDLSSNPETILDKWKTNKKTNDILNNYNKYACLATSTTKAVLVTSTKGPTSPGTPSSNVGGTQSTTQPASKNKVLVNVDDGGGLTKGSFYCFEDQVNHLADLQNQIRIYQSIADSCNAVNHDDSNSCSSKCSTAGDTNAIADCVHKCWNDNSSNCADKNNKVGDLRKQLFSDVQKYCP